MSLTPPLLSMLDNKLLQERYIKYLETHIELCEKELESIECNIIFTYLLFLIGPSLFDNVDLNAIKAAVTPEFFNELKNACIQFYTSNYLNRNEETFNISHDDGATDGSKGRICLYCLY